ncbi:MAG: hypothetical protein KC550_06835 [Nanoarchaeota archaeon]|nr:hypothetical protein [Nanoarchaeota archaeon]
MKKILLLIIISLISFSPIYAESNGIWNLAEDIRGGIFALDEQLSTFNFTFINPVYFLTNIEIFGNVKSDSLNTTEICINNDCKSAWPPASTLTPPPICNGNNALQWNGVTWSCKDFVPACANECAFNGQKQCSGASVLTCGNFDADSCLEWDGGSFCANGCAAGTCINCVSQNSFTCFAGNVWWYNSCGAREFVKQACPSGCTGNTCNIPTTLNLDCSRVGIVPNWYKTEGRCGDVAGMNYWEGQYAALVPAVKTAAQLHADFIFAYNLDCNAVAGTINRPICHNKLLCNPGLTYVTNTNYCVN